MSWQMERAIAQLFIVAHVTQLAIRGLLSYKIRYAVPTVMICQKKHLYGYLGENNIDSLVL